MPTDHVDSLTPQGRTVNQTRSPQDRARSGGAEARDDHALKRGAERGLSGPPEADVGAPAQPPGDETAKTVRARVTPHAPQGQGHDERGDYGRAGADEARESDKKP